MNKTIIAGLAILLLVVAAGTNMLYHSAEAKGMPQHWLKSDGTVKSQFQLVQKADQLGHKYPIVPGWTKNHN